MNLKYMPHQASYTVSISSECPFFSERKSTLSYDIEVKHLKIEGQESLIEVNKSNLLMNGEEVHDAFNDMLLITGGSLDKVVVRVDSNGRVLGLENHDEIKKRWFDLRTYVESMYQGDVICEYLDGMQSKLETSDTMWDALSKCFFYTVFFNGVYNNYGNGLNIQEMITIRDLLPTQGIEIPINKKISLDTETGCCLVSMNGSTQFNQLNYSTQDFFKEHIQLETFPDTCFIELKGDYNVYPKNGSINSITMEAQVTIENIYKKIMQIDVMRLPN